MSDAPFLTELPPPTPAILQDIAEQTARALTVLTRVPAIAVVMVDESGTGVICANGAAIDLKRMASAITRLAGTKPRPTDCTGCAEAYDRLAQANAILMQPTGKC